jgi:endo-1,4-beta-xylanase
MFAWAKSNGMAIRGHTLIWQEAKWLPKWVNESDFGKQGGKEAEALLRKHINTVCGHFGKDIISYDVVNEAIDRKTGDYHSNVLSERLGGTASEIELAFRIAHEAAPHAQLVYNDFMHWNAENAKHRAGVLRLLHELKKRGAPIHALGIQSHIGGWENSANKANVVREWRRFLDEVTGMGLDLLVTEFDVNDRQFPADFAERDAGIAALTKEYLDVTLSYPQAKDFLLWGMADHVSWLQDLKDAARKDGLQMRCTPFDEKLQAKPMRKALADVLRAMPQRA